MENNDAIFNRTVELRERSTTLDEGLRIGTVGVGVGCAVRLVLEDSDVHRCLNCDGAFIKGFCCYEGHNICQVCARWSVTCSCGADILLTNDVVEPEWSTYQLTAIVCQLCDFIGSRRLFVTHMVQYHNYSYLGADCTTSSNTIQFHGYTYQGPESTPNVSSTGDALHFPAQAPGSFVWSYVNGQGDYSLMTVDYNPIYNYMHLRHCYGKRNAVNVNFYCGIENISIIAQFNDTNCGLSTIKPSDIIHLLYMTSQTRFPRLNDGIYVSITTVI